MRMSQGRLQPSTAPPRREFRRGRALAFLFAACVLCGSGWAAELARAQAPDTAPERDDTALTEGTGPRVEAGIVRFPNAGAAPVASPAPPADLQDLSAWIAFRQNAHVEALPYQSRLFYRRGLLLHQSGNIEEALRLVYGAVELDPHYVAPHLTLASWLLARNPSQALLHYAVVLDLARKDFMMQLALGANSIYLGLQAILLALVAAGLMIVFMHQAELRHAWSERLARWLSPVTVRWWAWGLLVIPYFLGFGPVVPTVLLLGLLWPLLKLNERFVFAALAVFLATAPFTITALDTLATPLRENKAPYFGVTMVEKAPYRATMHHRLRALAQQHPDNGFVQFALAWTARRSGALDEAETAYRSALELWPNDDRIHNNLGNTLAARQRTEEASAAYARAIEINPSNAAAHFNLAQLKTLDFDFRAATDGVSRASALDFDMVKTYQASQTDDGYLPLVDQWLAPQTFWAAMPPVAVSVAGAPSLPPFWRTRVEFSGWPFSAATLALTVLAVFMGIRQNRSIPMRGCSNCGEVVCRRCAERRRERALCPVCAAIEAKAESPEFGRVLLSQHRRQHLQTTHLIRTALAALIPGYGLMAFRRIFPALCLFVAGAALASMWLGLAGPFPYEANLRLPDASLPVPVMVGLTVMLYAFSLIGYFANVARARAQAASLAAPTRSRAAQATARQPAAAA
jgi:tetratricopeptide (TPR) repeat protein